MKGRRALIMAPGQTLAKHTDVRPLQAAPLTESEREPEEKGG